MEDPTYGAYISSTRWVSQAARNGIINGLIERVQATDNVHHATTDTAFLNEIRDTGFMHWHFKCTIPDTANDGEETAVGPRILDVIGRTSQHYTRRGPNSDRFDAPQCGYYEVDGVDGLKTKSEYNILYASAPISWSDAVFDAVIDGIVDGTLPVQSWMAWLLMLRAVQNMDIVRLGSASLAVGAEYGRVFGALGEAFKSGSGPLADPDAFDEAMTDLESNSYSSISTGINSALATSRYSDALEQVSIEFTQQELYYCYIPDIPIFQDHYRFAIAGLEVLEVDPTEDPHPVEDDGRTFDWSFFSVGDGNGVEIPTHASVFPSSNTFGPGSDPDYLSPGTWWGSLSGRVVGPSENTAPTGSLSIQIRPRLYKGIPINMPGPGFWGFHPWRLSGSGSATYDREISWGFLPATTATAPNNATENPIDLTTRGRIYTLRPAFSGSSN